MPGAIVAVPVADHVGAEEVFVDELADLSGKGHEIGRHCGTKNCLGVWVMLGRESGLVDTRGVEWRCFGVRSGDVDSGVTPSAKLV